MTSVDIQLARDAEGRLPYLTHWSRHEPASIRRATKGNTDHWTKMKHKNVTFSTCSKDKTVKTFPGVRAPYEEVEPVDMHHIHHGYRVDGTMKHVGTYSFTTLLETHFNESWPGNYHQTRPPRRRNTRSVFNERAKEGFEYWLKEPKPLTAGGKRWIGAGGNVVGTSRK